MIYPLKPTILDALGRDIFVFCFVNIVMVGCRKFRRQIAFSKTKDKTAQGWKSKLVKAKAEKVQELGNLVPGNNFKVAKF